MASSSTFTEPGGDGLTLVLLPGLDGSGVLFGPLVDILPPTWGSQVIAFPKDVPLGYEELLPRVLADLPTDGPFLLLGESFAGPLALMAAHQRPPGLRGVVLSATFIQSPLRFRPSWLHHLVAPWMFRYFPALSRAKARLRGGKGLELVTLALEGVQPGVLAHRLRAVLQVDVREELRQCPVPVLYLQAQRDWVVPGHNAARVKACRPDVRIVAIPSSHLLLQTQPRLALQAIAGHYGLHA